MESEYMEDNWNALDNDMPEEHASTVWSFQQDVEVTNPCGRCSSERIRCERKNVTSKRDGSRHTYVRIFCSQCGAHTGWFDNFDDAWHLWNSDNYRPRIMKQHDSYLLDPGLLPVYDGT